MISIIICSRKPDISIELKSNIAASIGIAYELIVIDNSVNKYSIFSAYNEGVRRAKFPYLCFMHEDILFHTYGWGGKVVDYFSYDVRIGLIGIVGTHFLPQTPSYWCDSDLVSGGLIQGWRDKGIYKTERVKHDKYINKRKSIEAVAVDGLWFVMPKSIFEFISFDEMNFSGFHFYEMDICMQVHEAGYKVIIAMNILIEHYSYGTGDRTFNKSRSVFFKKWKSKLPIIAGVKISSYDIINTTTKIKMQKRRQSKYYMLVRKIKKYFKYAR